MPIVSTPLLQAGADGTGFTTVSVSTTSGRLLQLTLFCASSVSSPSVTGLGLTWVRIDDPAQLPNEPMQRWSAVATGSSGAITFAHAGSGGGIGYILEEIAGQAGSTVLSAYRDLGGGARATKAGTPYTPGVNGVPSAFSDADNRASVAFSGTQFGAWAGGTAWNGGVPAIPPNTALGLVGVTQTARSQTNPNISIDLIGAIGTDGQAAYSITWTSGPFTARSIYSEIIAADEVPTGIEPGFERLHRRTETGPTVAAPPVTLSVGFDRLSRRAEVGPSIAAPTATLSVGFERARRRSEVGAQVWRSEVAAVYPPHVRQLHSGHSLTDPGFYPWPGVWMYLLTQVIGVPFANSAKATIPGSPLFWRWANESTLNPSARFDIDDWQILVITEGVPLPDDGSSETYLSLYANNAWTNGNGGAGTPTLLFTTWTEWGGGMGPFRATLDAYESRWEAMADYATAQLPAGAPAIRLIPGHRMMGRFFDDIAAAATPPGIDAISDFFRDQIHVNDLGSYAWAMLHYACIFGLSPVGLPRDLWGPNNGWGNSPDTEGPPNIPTLEQATYIQTAVWDVVTSYARTGITDETVIAPAIERIGRRAEIGPSLTPGAVTISPARERLIRASEVGPSVGSGVTVITAAVERIGRRAETGPALSPGAVAIAAGTERLQRRAEVGPALVPSGVAAAFERITRRQEVGPALSPGAAILALALERLSRRAERGSDITAGGAIAAKDLVARITATHTATARPATWSPDQ